MIAVLGILSLILVPQFSLYGDKAMGTTALADCKSIVSMYTAYNMDSTTPLTLTKLAEMVGMPTAIGGGTTAYSDASGSKALSAFSANGVTYTYRRGDAVLRCVITFADQKMIWDSTLNNPARQDALAQGLKIAGTKDSGKTAITNAGTIGQLGYVAATTLTFPTK